MIYTFVRGRHSPAGSLFKTRADRHPLSTRGPRFCEGGIEKVCPREYTLSRPRGARARTSLCSPARRKDGLKSVAVESVQLKCHTRPISFLTSLSHKYSLKYDER
jgi:hypothetical protein